LEASLALKQAALLAAYPAMTEPEVKFAKEDLARIEAVNVGTSEYRTEPARWYPVLFSPAARQPRTLLQAEGERPCSKSEVDAVLNAATADRSQVVVGMFATNLACAICVVPCGDAPGMLDGIMCLLRCQNQNGNSCASENLANMQQFLRSAKLDDRQCLIRMLELAEADCAYCIVSTYESVCGEGCLDTVFHMFTDFPVIPRACLPELATDLASAQAAEARAALRAVRPFGLTVPAQTSATDIYSAVEDSELFEGWPIYRGVHLQKYMFRCTLAYETAEIWAVSSSDDRDSWGRCEAELWILLDAAQVRSDWTDPSSALGGVHFDFSVAQCHQQIRTFAASAGSATVQLTLEPSNSEIISFPTGTAAPDVACHLMLRLGPHNAAARTLPVVVRLAGMGETLKLVSDIVVKWSLCASSQDRLTL
jgi:hypothetical protein